MCHENGHGDTQYEHTHVYFETKRQMRSTNVKFFDIGDIHPNWKPVTTDFHKQHTLKYHQKEGIKCVQEPPYTPTDATKMRSLFDQKDLFEVMETLQLPIRSIGDAKALMESNRKRSATEITYAIDEFHHRMENIETVFVHGKAGTGKTQWAKAHFKSPLLIGSTDTLKEFRQELHDGIIFDDMSFTHWPRESVIQLLDWEEDRDVHCRFHNAFIPKNTKKVFISNKDLNETFGPYEFDEAITRRINAIYTVEEDLRKAPSQATPREPYRKTLKTPLNINGGSSNM